jgi:hypothetical protein
VVGPVGPRRNLGQLVPIEFEEVGAVVEDTRARRHQNIAVWQERGRAVGHVELAIERGWKITTQPESATRTLSVSSA